MSKITMILNLTINTIAEVITIAIMVAVMYYSLFYLVPHITNMPACDNGTSVNVLHGKIERSAYMQVIGHVGVQKTETQSLTDTQHNNTLCVINH